ncbi:MAG: hypothetical protein ACK4VY_01015 [Brevundimonas sp.]
MRVAIVSVLLATTLAACQQSSRWDSTNPVHCLTIFGIGSAAASAGSDAGVVDELNSRMFGIVQANGGVKWIEQVKLESQQFAAQLEAADDEPAALKLFDECAIRHPPSAQAVQVSRPHPATPSSAKGGTGLST